MTTPLRKGDLVEVRSARRDPCHPRRQRRAGCFAVHARDAQVLRPALLVAARAPGRSATRSTTAAAAGSTTRSCWRTSAATARRTTGARQSAHLLEGSLAPAGPERPPSPPAPADDDRPRCGSTSTSSRRSALGTSRSRFTIAARRPNERRVDSISRRDPRPYWPPTPRATSTSALRPGHRPRRRHGDPEAGRLPDAALRGPSSTSPRLQGSGFSPVSGSR